MLEKLYNTLARIYFVTATIMLMLIAAVLLLRAVWDTVNAVTAFDPVDDILDSLGLLIIGFAIVETGKFIAEEEILSKRELRSSVESRRSLTKFITIIVIAASLEALVMVFKTSRTEIPESIYPAALFVASMVALTALGAYQWMSSRIMPPTRESQRKLREEGETAEENRDAAHDDESEESAGKRGTSPPARKSRKAPRRR